jgi:hypothetical protein
MMPPWALTQSCHTMTPRQTGLAACAKPPLKNSSCHLDDVILPLGQGAAPNNPQHKQQHSTRK